MIDSKEWRFLLAGPTSSEVSKPNADPSWLTEKAWVEVLNLSQLSNFSGFAEHMASHMSTYRAIFDRSVFAWLS
jgi:dynein heavy chain